MNLRIRRVDATTTYLVKPPYRKGGEDVVAAIGNWPNGRKGKLLTVFDISLWLTPPSGRTQKWNDLRHRTYQYLSSAVRAVRSAWK